MRLFLIRHGESVANVEKTFAGQVDSKLTEKGIEQAKSIRNILERIPFDKVYSSDLSRAHDTQRYALPGVEAELTPLLREYDVGTWGGKPIAEAIEYEKLRKLDYAKFGGESRSMVTVRVEKFLAMLEEDPCDYVAAFSHNGFILNLMEIVMNAKVDRDGLASDNCAIHVFEFNGTGWRLLSWNYMRQVCDIAQRRNNKQGILL